MLRAYGAGTGRVRRGHYGILGGPGNARAVAGNPSFSQVAALLHFDGANNGTVFTDVKGTTFGRATGAAVTSTAQKKFGTASLSAVAGGIGSQTVPSLGYNPTTGDYCVEMWVYPNSTTAGWLAWLRDGTGGTTAGCWAVYWETGNVYVLGSKNGSTWAYSLSGGPLTLNAWSHVACVRNNGTFGIYVDGTLSANTFADPGVSYTATNALHIGVSAAGGGFDGYIDDFRYTVGNSVYSGNFFPPTQAFPDA